MRAAILRTLYAIAWGMILNVTGCAEGDLAEPPNAARSCSADSECPEGQRCNILERLCFESPTVDLGDLSDRLDASADLSGEEDMTMERDTRSDLIIAPDLPDLPDSKPDEGALDMEADSGEMDLAVDPCVGVTCPPQQDVCEGDFLLSYAAGVCDPQQGACGYAETRTDCTATANRRCEGGACVDRQCDPACEAPGSCQQGACVFPVCASEGDACDPSSTAQGGFLCLLDGGAGSNQAHCYASCQQANTAQGCGPGQFCIEVGNNASQQFCLNSECASDLDCAGGGTCLKFENSFGYCEPGGAVAPGGSCDSSTGQWCQQGAVCVRAQGASQGVCTTTCDPWGGSSSCSALQECAIYTNRTGICTGNLDPTGLNAFESCSMPGAYCDDATQCFSTSASASTCLKYCRPNSTDCSTIAPSLVCNTYAFAGERALGICFGACSAGNPCNASADCIGGLCRFRCTSASECGSGAWSCTAGYCE